LQVFIEQRELTSTHTVGSDRDSQWLSWLESVLLLRLLAVFQGHR
jgi:hypothetical protein